MDHNQPERKPFHDSYIRGYELLTPQQIVEIAANRAVIERAKGLLMFVYGIDDRAAFELLRQMLPAREGGSIRRSGART